MQRRAWTVARVAVLCTMVAVTLGGFMLVTTERAAACSCFDSTDDEAFAHADAAFTGTLVEIIAASGGSPSSTRATRFVFEVDDVFKGDVFARQSVVTAASSASCGLEITGQGPFVVFAWSEADGAVRGAGDDELHSGLCSGTRPLADGAVPSSFGAPSSPLTGSSPIGGGADPFLRNMLFVVLVGVLVVAAASSAVAIRRRLRSLRQSYDDRR